MRVYLGSDHAGFELKRRLLDHLTAKGHEPIDCGPFVYDPEDDYPPFVLAAAAAAAADDTSLGVVIGGSGNGEAIAANKVPGVRAALAWTQETAQLGRLHNNANVISIGARMVSEDDAVGFVDTFLATAFSGEPRHSRRIEMLTEYEQTHALPPVR
jgi:ribose 5-phosphate isomerase B